MPGKAWEVGAEKERRHRVFHRKWRKLRNICELFACVDCGSVVHRHERQAHARLHELLEDVADMLARMGGDDAAETDIAARFGPAFWDEGGDDEAQEPAGRAALRSGELYGELEA